MMSLGGKKNAIVQLCLWEQLEICIPGSKNLFYFFPSESLLFDQVIWKEYVFLCTVKCCPTWLLNGQADVSEGAEKRMNQKDFLGTDRC